MICVIRDALLDTCNESISNGKLMDWNTNIHAYIHTHFVCTYACMNVCLYVCIHMFVCIQS